MLFFLQDALLPSAWQPAAVCALGRAGRTPPNPGATDRQYPKLDSCELPQSDWRLPVSIGLVVETCDHKFWKTTSSLEFLCICPVFPQLDILQLL